MLLGHLTGSLSGVRPDLGTSASPRWPSSWPERSAIVCPSITRQGKHADRFAGAAFVAAVLVGDAVPADRERDASSPLELPARAVAIGQQLPPKLGPNHAPSSTVGRHRQARVARRSSWSHRRRLKSFAVIMRWKIEPPMAS